MSERCLNKVHYGCKLILFGSFVLVLLVLLSRTGNEEEELLLDEEMPPDWLYLKSKGYFAFTGIEQGDLEKSYVWNSAVTKNYFFTCYYLTQPIALIQCIILCTLCFMYILCRCYWGKVCGGCLFLVCLSNVPRPNLHSLEVVSYGAKPVLNQSQEAGY